MRHTTEENQKDFTTMSETTIYHEHTGEVIDEVFLSGFSAMPLPDGGVKYSLSIAGRAVMDWPASRNWKRSLTRSTRSTFFAWTARKILYGSMRKAARCSCTR
jgi:hypothetical protein